MERTMSARKEPQSPPVLLNVAGYKITVQPPSPLLPEVFAMPVDDWMSFSALEVQILRVLLADGPLKKEALAGRLNVSPDGAFKNLLPNLVTRNVIHNGPEGYFVNVTTERRIELLQWLDQHYPGGAAEGTAGA